MNGDMDTRIMPPAIHTKYYIFSSTIINITHAVYSATYVTCTRYSISWQQA